MMNWILAAIIVASMITAAECKHFRDPWHDILWVVSIFTFGCGMLLWILR